MLLLILSNSKPACLQNFSLLRPFLFPERFASLPLSSSLNFGRRPSCTSLDSFRHTWVRIQLAVASMYHALSRSSLDFRSPLVCSALSLSIFRSLRQTKITVNRHEE